MVRGLYTGASGMMATQSQLDIVANNLANVNTTGYKKETPILKAFPEMLIRRTNADGVVTFPLGSYDLAPMVGSMGTGVELNESFTQFDQGTLIETSNSFDFALEGEGFLVVQTDAGERYTRAGDFTVSSEGYLVDQEGNYVMGENGEIQIGRNNFTVDTDGKIYINAEYEFDDMVNLADNDFENMELLDTLKIVNFNHTDYLEKEGYHLYKESDFSGEPEEVSDDERPLVYQGFLEGSNVNPVIEMTRMIEIQRLYEANQKAIQTHDSTLEKAVTQVARGVG